MSFSEYIVKQQEFVDSLPPSAIKEELLSDIDREIERDRKHRVRIAIEDVQYRIVKQRIEENHG